MKCPVCKGKGTIERLEAFSVADIVMHEKCKNCNGTGEITPTNEEWFNGMYTEAKAEWLADHMKCSKCPQQDRCNGYHGGCVVLMLEWLKQPRREE